MRGGALLPDVDWAVPWLAPLAQRGAAVQARANAVSSVAVALNEALALARETDEHFSAPVLAAGALRFVPQSELPAGVAYEAHIHQTARVPTRDNLHDLFNGLMWLHQATLKRRLNALQAEALARDGVGRHRGPLRDALTLFDENGALLQGPEPVLSALRERRWHDLFVTHRALWSQARLTVFGHALMEQLAVAPRKGLTAHVLLAGADDCVRWPADVWAARPTKPFVPLPLLGVPGWWPGQSAAGFYDDVSVFRPARSLQSTGSAHPCRS